MNELAVVDEYPYKEVENFLRLENESSEYWQDEAMKKFQEQYWIPMNNDLKILSQALEKTGKFLGDLGKFFLELVFYGMNAIIALL